jgi:hypothetical protein
MPNYREYSRSDGLKMVPVRVFLCTLVTLLSTALVAHAEEKAENKAAQALVTLFIRTCVESMPNLDRVEAAAKALGWWELDDVTKRMLAPRDPSARFNGWNVRGSDASYMIGISQGADGNKAISNCVINSSASPVPVIAALKSELKLKDPLRVGYEGGQGNDFKGARVTYWRTRVADHNILISSAEPMDEPGTTLSATVIFDRN